MLRKQECIESLSPAAKRLRAEAAFVSHKRCEVNYDLDLGSLETFAVSWQHWRA